MFELNKTEDRLKLHLKALTETIGERSVRTPENLNKTVEYIISYYQEIGIKAWREPYNYKGFEVANVVAEISSGPNPARRYVLGAHYDSVAGTVGADDNASAVAVQLAHVANLRSRPRLPHDGTPSPRRAPAPLGARCCRSNPRGART